MSSAGQKVRLALLFLLVFAVGAILGGAGASWAYYHYLFSKEVPVTAMELTRDLQMVSHLRLGEVDPVIRDLEMTIDARITGVVGPQVRLTDYTRKALATAAAYRRVYPSSADAAGQAQVAQALKDVTPLEISGGKGPIQRLLQREAGKASQ